jgi:hypothetical protein
VPATLLLGLVWALWHLPLVPVDSRLPHRFASLAPLVLPALLTLLGIVFMALFLYLALQQPAGRSAAYAPAR